jgi:Xaa-Pro aminopeptidase
MKEEQMTTEHALTRAASLSSALALERPPHRLDRLRAWMEEQRLHACVVAGEESVAHLGGYRRYYGGPSALVIDRDGRRTLVVMTDEVPVARERGEADEVVGYGERGFGINLNPLPALVEVVAAQPAVRASARIGLADGLGGLAGALAAASSAELVDASDVVARIRLVRDEDELVWALHGYELSWIGQAAVRERLAPGVSEIELFTAAHSAAQLAHGEPIAFAADLLSGPLTAEVCAPIHIAGRRVLEEGDPVIADVVIGAGYSGDTAETFVVGTNDEVLEQRAALLQVLDDCAAELQPGNTGAEIFASMHRRVIGLFPDGELPHHGGHGVSVTAFEDPHMIPSDRTPLESWMLISLEPGVYFPGRHGVRVEASYIVTPDGGLELRDALGAR